MAFRQTQAKGNHGQPTEAAHLPVSSDKCGSAGLAEHYSDLDASGPKAEGLCWVNADLNVGLFANKLNGAKPLKGI